MVVVGIEEVWRVDRNGLREVCALSKRYARPRLTVRRGLCGSKWQRLAGLYRPTCALFGGNCSPLAQPPRIRKDTRRTRGDRTVFDPSCVTTDAYASISLKCPIRLMPPFPTVLPKFYRWPRRQRFGTDGHTAARDGRALPGFRLIRHQLIRYP
jgi:hypothetical protein